MRPIPKLAKNLGFNAHGVVALRYLMITMVVLAVGLFFAPFLLRRRLVKGAGFWRGSIFFTAIGLAFMLIEVAWLQRFVRYLGHPSVATAATLGFMLLGAGGGSLTSARVGLVRWQKLAWLAAAVTLAMTLLQTWLFEATLGFELPLRLLVAGVLLLPAGWVMGLMFPLGMERFAEASRPWFWALNGCAGVLASVCSLALAMEIGFAAVSYLGSGIYLAAWWAIREQ